MSVPERIPGGFPYAGDLLFMNVPTGPPPPGWTLVDTDDPDRRFAWRYAQPGDLPHRDVVVYRPHRTVADLIADQESTMAISFRSTNLTDTYAARTVIPGGEVLRATTDPSERQIECPVCHQTGALEEFDPGRGFKISHPGRVVACRAPADPPQATNGQADVPVEISEN